MQFRKRSEVLEEDLVLASGLIRTLSFITDVIIITTIYALFQITVQYLGFELKHIKVETFTHIEFESENISKTAKFVIQCILTAIPTLYFTLTVFFLNGQTLGKKIFRIRVLSIYHKKLGFWHSVERSLGYVASALEFGLGFLQALWNPNRMTLHDKIAETIVVKTIKKK